MKTKSTHLRRHTTAFRTTRRKDFVKSKKVLYAKGQSVLQLQIEKAIAIKNQYVGLVALFAEYGIKT